MAALGAEILEERARLTRLEDDVRRRTARLAALEEELSGLLGRSAADSKLAPAAAPPAPLDAPRETVELRQPVAPDALDYLLCRCEGFEVESHSVTVGIVEGVRFGTRVDRPDLIEVRTRTLGHRLVLVPVEDVERIDNEEERVFLRAVPVADELTLLARLRKMLAHAVGHKDDRIGDPHSAG